MFSWGVRLCNIILFLVFIFLIWCKDSEKNLNDKGNGGELNGKKPIITRLSVYYSYNVYIISGMMEKTCKILAKLFAHSKKKYYFCIRFNKNTKLLW